MAPTHAVKSDAVPLARTLHETGELADRIEALRELQKECRLCPRNCRARRFEGKTGVCNATAQPVVSSAFAHFGEEPELVGRGGSGTIFLSHCNLRCLFCQNYEISHLGEGRPVTAEQIARMMISLQELGCHNINFVTPTHFVPQLVEAIAVALDHGLAVPIVYNCGGYESLEVLKLLDGIIDIYMPDFKFASEDTAKRYAGVKDYFEVAKAAIREMHRQVGDLQVDTKGLARRGLLIRHLVMPGLVDESKRILDFIAHEISKDTYVNIMEQYRPCYRATEFPELRRRITYDEWWAVKEYGRRLGLHRGF
jgi:putative pyruvate formate lyase activating enzyme